MMTVIIFPPLVICSSVEKLVSDGFTTAVKSKKASTPPVSVCALHRPYACVRAEGKDVLHYDLSELFRQALNIFLQMSSLFTGVTITAWICDEELIHLSCSALNKPITTTDCYIRKTD